MSVNSNTLEPPNPLVVAGLQKQFSDLGLGDLWTIIDGYITSGIEDPDTIFNVMAADPAAQAVVNKRFPALAARQNTDHPIGIKEYLQLEDQYRNLVQQAGLPAGFYDKNSDYTKWIADDVAPTEISARINTAATAVTQADPNIRAALRDYYGVDDAGIMAHFLDPKTAVDVLTTQYGAAIAGGAYKNAGLSLNKQLAEEIGAVTGANNGQQVNQAASQIAQDSSTAQMLGGIWGEDLTSEDLTRDTFNLAGGADAARKKNRLASQERAAFGGGSAVNTSSLSRGSNSQI